MKKKYYWIIGIIVLIISVTGFVILNLKVENCIDKKCNSDNDCTFVNLVCCSDCGYGEPVNKKSAEIINKLNEFQCYGSMCPMIKCGSTTGYILMEKSVCKNNGCVSDQEMDCETLCYYKKINETRAINNTANVLNITIRELENRCTCD